MAFIVGKLIWYLAAPTSLLIGLFLAGLLLQATPWRRFGQRLLCLAAAVLVVIALLPVGQVMLLPLEDRFPPPRPLPEKVDGIVLLGGASELTLSKAREQPVLNDAGERILAFAALARRYPQARLVASGGSGSIVPSRLREVDVTRQVLEQLGLETSRVRFENASRNTYDNARLAKPLAKPRPGETWLLVTSAWHMPRAVGTFRRAGWPVVAYPVDYRTAVPIQLGFRAGLASGVADFDVACHEWLGLLVYRLLGRTDAFFPAPASEDG